MKQPTDLITAAEARQLLGVSPPKLTAMIKDKMFTIYEDPLDKRVKLLSKAEVEAARAPRKRAA
jgi:hypothetical protein